MVHWSVLYIHLFFSNFFLGKIAKLQCFILRYWEAGIHSGINNRNADGVLLCSMNSSKLLYSYSHGRRFRDRTLFWDSEYLCHFSTKMAEIWSLGTFFKGVWTHKISALYLLYFQSYETFR